MCIAAGTAAPCAGLLLGVGLQRFFSAVSAIVAHDAEDNSDDGFDDHLIRAAIVCAAAIVGVSSTILSFLPCLLFVSQFTINNSNFSQLIVSPVYWSIRFSTAM
jgi:hypothetical protein